MDTKSKWNNFFKYNEVLKEIDKDVRRTLSSLSFFNGENSTRQESLKRILFVYSQLNPGIGYVQGMNEVLAVIYYVIAKEYEGKEEETICSETDAFFCFTSLMGEIMNHFCNALDNTDYGINAEVVRLDNLLKEKDLELWNNLNEKELKPSFYSLRWIMLLLSQEFLLPDVLRLWDSFLADEKRFKFLIYFCCAMIM